MQEFYTTEQQYVEALQLLVEVSDLAAGSEDNRLFVRLAGRAIPGQDTCRVSVRARPHEFISMQFSNSSQSEEFAHRKLSYFPL